LLLPALYVLGELGIDSEYLSLLVAGPPFFWRWRPPGRPVPRLGALYARVRRTR